jgi:UDP-N-acetylmuramyl pentapeptide synthase
MATKITKNGTKPRTAKVEKEVAKRRELARPGDPYVAPDKSIIEPEPLSRTPAIDVNTKIEPKDFKPNARRTLKDLPADVRMVNACSCIFMYTLMGIGDRQISEALKISITQVHQIREHSAYAECFNLVVGEFINANSDHIQARIAAYSHGALSQTAKIAFMGEKENNKLKASLELLNMAGFSKKDVAGKGDALMNELRIIMVEGEGTVNVNVGMNGAE